MSFGLSLVKLPSGMCRAWCPEDNLYRQHCFERAVSRRRAVAGNCAWQLRDTPLLRGRPLRHECATSGLAITRSSVGARMRMWRWGCPNRPPPSALLSQAPTASSLFPLLPTEREMGREEAGTSRGRFGARVWTRIGAMSANFLGGVGALLWRWVPVAPILAQTHAVRGGIRKHMCGDLPFRLPTPCSPNPRIPRPRVGGGGGRLALRRHAAEDVHAQAVLLPDLRRLRELRPPRRPGDNGGSLTPPDDRPKRSSSTEPAAAVAALPGAVTGHGDDRQTRNSATAAIT